MDERPIEDRSPAVVRRVPLDGPARRNSRAVAAVKVRLAAMSPAEERELLRFLAQQMGELVRTEWRRRMQCRTPNCTDCE